MQIGHIVFAMAAATFMLAGTQAADIVTKKTTATNDMVDDMHKRGDGGRYLKMYTGADGDDQLIDKSGALRVNEDRGLDAGAAAKLSKSTSLEQKESLKNAILWYLTKWLPGNKQMRARYGDGKGHGNYYHSLRLPYDP